MMDKQKETQDAIELIKLALIYTRNNSDDFLETRLMKMTNYNELELHNLTNNFVYYEKASFKGISILEDLKND